MSWFSAIVDAASDAVDAVADAVSAAAQAAAQAAADVAAAVAAAATTVVNSVAAAVDDAATWAADAAEYAANAAAQQVVQMIDLGNGMVQFICNDGYTYVMSAADWAAQEAYYAAQDAYYAAESVVTTVADAAETAAEAVGAAVGDAAEAVVGVAEDVAEAVADAGEAVHDAMADAGHAIVDAARDVVKIGVEKVLPAATGMVERMEDEVENVVEDVVDGVRTVVRTAARETKEVLRGEGDDDPIPVATMTSGTFQGRPAVFTATTEPVAAGSAVDLAVRDVDDFTDVTPLTSRTMTTDLGFDADAPVVVLRRGTWEQAVVDATPIERLEPVGEPVIESIFGGDAGVLDEQPGVTATADLGPEEPVASDDLAWDTGEDRRSEEPDEVDAFDLFGASGDEGEEDRVRRDQDEEAAEDEAFERAD